MLLVEELNNVLHDTMRARFLQLEAIEKRDRYGDYKLQRMARQ